MPHGFKYGDSWILEAKIRPINGHDEKFLLNDCNELTFPTRITMLLSRLVSFCGIKISRLEKEKILQMLPLGDRIVILLHARRLSYGETISCTLTCSNCNEPLSLDLTISQLLGRQKSDKSHENNYDISVGKYHIKIRPITGLDQELLLRLPSGTTRSVYEAQLVRSCILSSSPSLPTTLDHKMIAAINLKLEEIDPQADIILNLSCHVCKHEFAIPFYVDDIILQEIDRFANLLEYDIHILAGSYHWKEKDILSLSTGQRKRYVDLVTKMLSGEAA